MRNADHTYRKARLMKNPRDYGFDAGNLKRVDRFLAERYLDTGVLANAQILINRDGEIVHFSSQGKAQEESAIRIFS